MSRREFDRALFRVIKAYTSDDDNYQWKMDDLSVACSDEQWEHVVNTLDMVHDPDFIKGELPLETIIPDDYCDWGHGGVER